VEGYPVEIVKRYRRTKTREDVKGFARREGVPDRPFDWDAQRLDAVNGDNLMRSFVVKRSQPLSLSIAHVFDQFGFGLRWTFIGASDFGSIPIIENSEPNFRKGSTPVVENCEPNFHFGSFSTFRTSVGPVSSTSTTGSAEHTQTLRSRAHGRH
jgi:hypothetical protein